MLVDPSHHSFASAWTSQVEQALTAREQQDLALIRRSPQTVAFTDILLRSGPRLTPEALAERIAVEPPELVAQALAGEVLPLEEMRGYRSHRPSASIFQAVRPDVMENNGWIPLGSTRSGLLQANNPGFGSTRTTQ